MLNLHLIFYYELNYFCYLMWNCDYQLYLHAYYKEWWPNLSNTGMIVTIHKIHEFIVDIRIFSLIEVELLLSIYIIINAASDLMALMNRLWVSFSSGTPGVYMF